MPTPYRIEWRPLARDDLLSIVRYIGKDSVERAKRFGGELKAKTESLALHPAMGRPGRIAGTRELVVHPNYIVFYRVQEDAKTVQVLRIKHAARLFP